MKFTVYAPTAEHLRKEIIAELRRLEGICRSEGELTIYARNRMRLIGKADAYEYFADFLAEVEIDATIQGEKL